MKENDMNEYQKNYLYDCGLFFAVVVVTNKRKKGKKHSLFLRFFLEKQKLKKETKSFT